MYGKKKCQNDRTSVLSAQASFKVLEKAPESSKMPKLISLSLSAGGSPDRSKCRSLDPVDPVDLVVTFGLSPNAPDSHNSVNNTATSWDSRDSWDTNENIMEEYNQQYYGE